MENNMVMTSNIFLMETPSLCLISTFLDDVKSSLLDPLRQRPCLIA